MTTTQIKLPESKLATCEQSKTKSFSFIENGKDCKLIVKLRYDDTCRNGHNSFSITASLYENNMEVSGGCLHDEIIKHAPEFSHLIKWHLVSSDGPMHYVENTKFWALMSKGDVKLEGTQSPETALAFAQKTAVWPNATLEQLLSEDKLMNRLPIIMNEFKKVIKSIGFTY